MKIFGKARLQLVGTAIAAIGGLALTACNSSCGCTCKPVYQKPCCAQSQARCGSSCGAKPAPGAPAPKAAPAGGQMQCGAGKCG